MRLFVLYAIAAGMIGMGVARGQLAITETMPSANNKLGSTTVTQGPDFWELTNFGTNTMDLSGYIFNDSDAIRGGDADSTTLSGVTIGPGESIILVQTGVATVQTRDDFINWWGAANLPANIQVLFYSGNGLSASGDSIVLWAPTATSDADIVDRADFGEAVRGHTFTYDPTNGTFGIVSSNGVGGAFKAVTADDEGSPGVTTGPVALKINQQPTPAAMTVPTSQNVTFTVAAQGLPRPHFQWLFNGVAIDGAIQSSLTLTNVQLSDAGQYSVLVTNGVESVTSSNAVLTVTASPASPTFLATPTNADAFINQIVRFTAQANGSPTPALQWEKDGVAIPGQTSPQLNLPFVQTNDAGLYTLIASNSAGITNISAILTVGEKPRLAITEVQPSGSSEHNHSDWWELTSFDTRTFNLKGWRWDDSSHSVAPGNAYVFTNDIYIHPGESVVFAENTSGTPMTPDLFRAWWGTNLPPGLQVVIYGGGGLGLSTDADEVNLWNAVTLPGNELAERVCGVNFAATAAGWTLIYDPDNLPVVGVLSVASTNTVAGNDANGVFAAEVLGTFGSPGYVVAPIEVSASQISGEVSLTWNSTGNRHYTVEYKTSLFDPAWITLSNVTATATSTTIADPIGAGSRFYRVGVSVPFVSEP